MKKYHLLGQLQQIHLEIPMGLKINMNNQRIFHLPKQGKFKARFSGKISILYHCKIVSNHQMMFQDAHFHSCTQDNCILLVHCMNQNLMLFLECIHNLRLYNNPQDESHIKNLCGWFVDKKKRVLKRYFGIDYLGIELCYHNCSSLPCILACMTHNLPISNLLSIGSLYNHISSLHYCILDRICHFQA
ncbi:unnamed protein product [Blepharisma stoltei]|uniref:Uncharacterized protein n=1 Tax=Blepharisma stoltei TaxID=1481888 RepID=A0AAU9IFI2_9CILI|nr:unnamed protein product [Blepharisma stoltei]